MAPVVGVSCQSWKGQQEALCPWYTHQKLVSVSGEYVMGITLSLWHTLQKPVPEISAINSMPDSGASFSIHSLFAAGPIRSLEGISQ